MESVTKKSTKTIEQYRHNIKLLKYYLKKEQKLNQTLRYKDSKKNKKDSLIKDNQNKEKHILYAMLDIVSALNSKLREIGLSLGDIFRMADSNYEGEITKQQFMQTVSKIKANLDENQINQMFYTIDSNLNGRLSSDQYTQFLSAHGGSDSKDAFSFQKETSEKFLAILKKKKINSNQFISKLLDPAPLQSINEELKKLGLNINQAMILFKTWDPSMTGFVKHEVYIKSMQNVKQKDEKQINNEKYQKGIIELCVIFRDRKLNPIEIFEAADVDGTQGITIFELQEGFKKIMPDETSYQIKKWISIINVNGDSQITKQQFVSAIRSFYSLLQINEFSNDYDKIHPKLKKAFAEQQIPTQKILDQLSIYIEDNGLTKAEVFNRIDINHNGTIDKQELLTGLQVLGMNIVFVGKVLAVFDRDVSGEIGMDQWLSILGQDLEMEDVEGVDNKKAKQLKKDKAKTKEKQKVKPKQKPAEKQKDKPKEKPQEKPKIKPIQKLQQKAKEKGKQISQIKEDSKVEKKQPSKKDEQSLSKPSKIIKKEQSKIEKKPIKNEDIQQSPGKNLKQTTKKSVQKNALKDHDKNKINVSKINNSKQIKKQAKAAPKAVKKDPELFESFAESEKAQNNNESQYIAQEQQVSNQALQREVGENYAKNRKKTSQIFLKCSKNNKKGLSKIELQQFLKQIKVKTSYQPKQIDRLFEQNCSTNGLINLQWLQRLIQIYDLQIQPSVQEVTKPSSVKKKESILPVQKEAQIQQNHGYSQDYDNQNQNQEEQKAPKQPNNQSQKRGQNLEQFKKILDITVQNQKINQQGYKLSKYIDCKQELQLLEQKYKPLAKSIIKNKKLFQDKSFPSTLASLTHVRPNQSQIPNVTLLKWKHYKEFYKKPEVFKDSISPNDIRQGTLGDCYFLCSLAALAQYKNLIERLFQYFDIDNGYFLVWLCIDGAWRLIELDGYFPVVPTGDRPAFSHGEDNQLWVMLLEKAYAKAYGNYQKIIGGQPYEAIKDLSGAPGQSFTHKSKNQQIKEDDIWKKLVQANKEQFIMTCGTDVDKEGKIKMDGHSESVTNEGIVLGHAYSILDIRQYKKQKLIQLRNPWGQTEWKGDWSDKSEKWTQHAKKQLGYSSLQEDGIFWMPFSAYFEKYNTTAINYIRPNHYYSSGAMKSVKSLVIKIKPNSIKHGFIMATQRDHRKDGIPSNTPYNLTNIIALNYKKGKLLNEISNEKYLYQREGSAQICNLSEGSEIVVLVNLEKKSDIFLCSYSDIQFDSQVDLQAETMMQYIEDLAKLEQRAKNVQQTPNLFKSWMVSVGQYAFLVFKSVSQKQIGFNVLIQAPKNLELIPRSSSISMKLQPKQTKTVKGKIINQKDPYSFGPLQFTFER